MSGIAVVTDSNTGLPLSLIRELGIVVVPIHLEWDGRSYLDGIDIRADELYRQMKAKPSLFIHSSTPSPGEFLDAYDRLIEQGKDIVSIHLAESLTSIVNVAREAASMRPNARVVIADSGSASMGCGFAVLAAARKAAVGASIDEVAGEAERVGRQTCLYGLLETLRYVRHSGRLTEVGGRAAGLLRLKPLIVLKEGRVRFLGVERTRQKGLRRLLRLVARHAHGQPIRAAVVHAGAHEDATLLARTLDQQQDCRELILSEFTPVLGGHTGPGLVGIVFHPEE